MPDVGRDDLACVDGHFLEGREQLAVLAGDLLCGRRRHNHPVTQALVGAGAGAGDRCQGCREPPNPSFRGRVTQSGGQRPIHPTTTPVTITEVMVTVEKPATIILGWCETTYPLMGTSDCRCP